MNLLTDYKLNAILNSVTCIIGAIDCGIGRPLSELSDYIEVRFLKVCITSTVRLCVLKNVFSDPFCHAILSRVFCVQRQGLCRTILQKHLYDSRIPPCGQYHAYYTWRLDHCVFLRDSIPGQTNQTELGNCGDYDQLANFLHCGDCE